MLLFLLKTPFYPRTLTRDTASCNLERIKPSEAACSCHPFFSVLFSIRDDHGTFFSNVYSNIVNRKQP
jgi:hypothetical protein